MVLFATSEEKFNGVFVNGITELIDVLSLHGGHNLQNAPVVDVKKIANSKRLLIYYCAASCRFSETENCLI